MSEEHHRHGGTEPTGPGDAARPGDAPDPADGAAAPGDDRGPSAPEPLDEDALRHLLRDTVRDIEPTPGVLDDLHRAVRARRARRRNTVVGAAAAVLACVVGLSAAWHADFGPIGGKAMRNAGHAQDRLAQQQAASPGSREAPGTADGSSRTGGGSGEAGPGAGVGIPTSGTSTGPDPSSSLGPVSPGCTREQLGAWSADLGEPDEQGRVHGAFTVINTSENSCTVDGDGIVTATARGSAKSALVQVVDHTTGDEATGLPDPVMAADEVVLEPEAAYVVRFAWIPREGGGPTGCSPSSPTDGGETGDAAPTTPGPEPMGSSGSLQEDGAPEHTGTETGDGSTDGSTETGSGSSGSSGGTGGSGSSGGSGGSGSTDGSTGSTDGDEPSPAPPSVAVSHTPDVGEPVVGEIVIEQACAGTLYRTGVLPAA
ncbi:hypothetical protein [Streptomyces sp. TR06-5]|uniref:hypothetical protein n=1 Tax=unclassified Streptomyces TaxID=2593676 RepID=UPI0039A05A93